MQLYQGTHLVIPKVKQIPREKPVEKVDQTEDGNAPVPVISSNLIDLSDRTLNLKDPGPSNHTVGNDLFEDQRKKGHDPFGGYGTIKGDGILGPGLENFPMAKEGYEVPKPELSFEVRRRLPLRPHIAKDHYGTYAAEFDRETVKEYDLNQNVIMTANVRSHQYGYKATKKGPHGPDVSVNNADFGSQDKEPTLYVDPNKEANSFKYGAQAFVVNDNFGVPYGNLDGRSLSTLKSREVVPEVNQRAAGSRAGGHMIAGKNRVGFR